MGDSGAASWPAAGVDGQGGVADAAFTATRESSLAAPPAAEYLHPVRVDRDGGVAVLVCTWRADPRRFAVRVDLPTDVEAVDVGWGRGMHWGHPDPHTGLMTSAPVDWADGVRRVPRRFPLRVGGGG